MWRLPLLPALLCLVATACGGEPVGPVPDASSSDVADDPYELVMAWHEPTYGEFVDLIPLADGVEIPRIWGLQGSPMIVLGFTAAAEAIDEPYISCTFTRSDDDSVLSDPKYRDELRLIEQDDGHLRHDHFFMVVIDDAVDPDGATEARLWCDYCGATAEFDVLLVDP